VEHLNSTKTRGLFNRLFKVSTMTRRGSDGAPGGRRGVVRGEDDAARTGAGPGEIVLRNQTTWMNNMNLAQTEYMVGAAAQTTTGACGWRDNRCPPQTRASLTRT